MKAVLKWLSKGKRYHEDASRRWGHYYDDAVRAGLCDIAEPEAYMNGRYRDIRRPVSLTDAGRSALSEAEEGQQDG